MPDNGSINESTTGTSAGTATALSQTAQDYGQKISDVDRNPRGCGRAA